VSTRKRTSKTSVGTKSTAAKTAGKKAPARKKKAPAAKKRTSTRARAAAAPEPVAVPEALAASAAMVPAVVAEVIPASPETAAEVAASGGRRGIFFDVENTSRSEDIGRVLEHLGIDWTRQAVTFTAVGNWRVIGHETARLLAQRGASLVHSAPSVGVRDWSDLRIAVGAGVWLAGARPGDVIEIVSDDQAFDAVGDVAASLGVTFRRLSYRALAGVSRTSAPAAEPIRASAPRSSSRRRRGGRRTSRDGRDDRRDERNDRRDERRSPVAASPRPQPSRPHAVVERPAPAAADVDEVPAPEDEIVGLLRDLLIASPRGVSLDVLANELRERGFRRPPGSYRLITRLKHIKEVRVIGGNITLAESSRAAEPARTLPPPRRAEPAHVAETPIALEPPADGWEVVDAEIEAELVEGDEPEGEGEVAEAAGDESSAENGTSNGGTGRRRRRRGGRRRRGRRNGNGETTAAPAGEGPAIEEPGELDLGPADLDLGPDVF